MSGHPNYLVFARKTAEDALAALGTVTAEADAAAAAHAKSSFGEDWLEMIAIPESVAAWAIREE